jgi:putative FmdB family regulatory protein
MPIYEYLCQDCGETSEQLIFSGDQEVSCTHCGSKRLKKLLSAQSSLSGPAPSGLPGPGDTPCCGSSPSQAGCAGPGSCCGRQP